MLMERMHRDSITVVPAAAASASFHASCPSLPTPTQSSATSTIGFSPAGTSTTPRAESGSSIADAGGHNASHNGAPSAASRRP
jgi:hypothetical protein